MLPPKPPKVYLRQASAGAAHSKEAVSLLSLACCSLVSFKIEYRAGGTPNPTAVSASLPPASSLRVGTGTGAEHVMCW